MILDSRWPSFCYVVFIISRKSLVGVWIVKIVEHRIGVNGMHSCDWKDCEHMWIQEKFGFINLDLETLTN